jgi:hypothetical protein
VYEEGEYIKGLVTESESGSRMKSVFGSADTRLSFGRDDMGRSKEAAERGA